MSAVNKLEYPFYLTDGKLLNVKSENTINPYEELVEFAVSTYYDKIKKSNLSFEDFFKKDGEEKKTFICDALQDIGTDFVIRDGDVYKANNRNGVIMQTTTTGIGTTKFNSSSNRAEYVGYMYTTNSQHGYQTSSLIKNSVDNWFKNTTLNGDTNVVDNVFCNDRNLPKGTWNSIPTNKIEYGPRKRFLDSLIPSLNCENSQDRFTKSTTIGNGKLIYPVGLITADEVSLAGSYWLSNNQTFYLYTGYSYYTMSPNLVKKYSSGSIISYVFIMTEEGNMPNYSVTSTAYIRPVINLNGNVKLSGTGTYDNVYEVVK